MSQTLSLALKFRRSNTLVTSTSDVLERYLFGIPLVGQNGQRYTEDSMREDIASAQKELENYLDIKIAKQIIKESRDFNANDWEAWGYVPTSYPVNKAFVLEGYLGTTRQMIFPKEWLTTHESSDELYYRKIFIIPNAAGISEFNQNVFVSSGILPHVGYGGNRFIPNYWRITYCT
ncbi:MAG: hypothetical protein JHC54_11290, partial [Acinetobacter sp.]|nr:hypothetical protein [Acinetobacter sp.]